MSNPLSIHLFNCDRTYKLDAIEDWLNEARQAKPKLEGQFAIKQHYFSLSEMSDLSSKKIPSLQMDMAVFVLHAHESRLSINEDNAGIGYAKIYRALLQATGDNVIIVIGGDDNYKNEDEENKEFISRWAKRKVSSQFNEEFLDGRKSFIFSWNKKHREIHEEALVHFFDTSKKGQKFEYQPKPKLPSVPVAPPPSMVTESARRSPEEIKLELRPGASGPLQYDDRTEERMTGDRYKGYGQSLGCGKVTGDISSPYTIPGQPSWATVPTRSKPEEANPQLPDLAHGIPSGRSEGKIEDSGVHAPIYTEKAKADLSVLGWEAKPESLSAVNEFIQRHRDILNLATDPYILNKTVQEMILCLEKNPLKYCVLVVDAEKVEAARRDHQHQVDYLRLLQSAERNVEEKIFVIVCCPLSMSKDDEKVVNQTVENAFSDNKKVCVEWFKNGKPALGEDEFNIRLTEAIAGSGSNYPQHQSNSTQYSQIPLSGTGQPYCQENVASGSLKKCYNQPSFASGSQLAPPGPQGITENQSSHLLTDSTENQPSLPPTDSTENKPSHLPTVSTEKKSSHLPTDSTENQLSHLSTVSTENKPSHLLTDSTENQLSHLPTVSTENKPSHLPTDSYNYKVVLPPGKTVMLLTRLRNGEISFRKEDVQYQKPNFTVPDYMKSHLLREHSKTSDAELVILMNEKDEFVCQVNEKKDKGWHQFIILALDETIMLKTHLKYGRVSYEDKDVVVRYSNWQIPDDVVANLTETFQEIADAELFVILDSQANLKCIVQVGATRYTGIFMSLINEGGPKTGYKPADTNWEPRQMAEAVFN